MCSIKTFKVSFFRTQTYKKINICRPNRVALCDTTKEVERLLTSRRSTQYSQSDILYCVAFFFLFPGGWAARLQRFTCCGEDLSSRLSTHVSSGHWRALSGSLTWKQGKPPAYTQDAQPCKLNMHLSKKVLIKIPNRGRERFILGCMQRKCILTAHGGDLVRRGNIWPEKMFDLCPSFFRASTSCSLFFWFCFVCFFAWLTVVAENIVLSAGFKKFKFELKKLHTIFSLLYFRKKSFAMYRTVGVMTSSVKSDNKHSLCVLLSLQSC